MTMRRRRKVRPWTTKQAGLVMLLGTVMVLVGVLLYLWPQMRLVSLGYRQGTLQARSTRALWRQKELQVELATLRRLSRIEKIARQRLGMRSPQVSQIVYVHPGGRLVVSGRQP
jgi:cell division protein FtsL